MAKNLIYITRPLGKHPAKTRMGELELGRVHRLSVEEALPYLRKGFTPCGARGGALEEAEAARIDGLVKAAAEAQTTADAEKEAKTLAARLAAESKTERFAPEQQGESDDESGDGLDEIDPED